MTLRTALLAAALVTLPATASSPLDAASESLSASVRRTVGTRTARDIAIPPAITDPAVHQTNPVIASDGESFVIVWRESTECCFWRDEQETTGSLYATRLDARGERMGQPRLISSGATGGTPGLAFDGTNYLLVWSELGPLGLPRLVGQRLSTELTLVDAAPFVIRTSATGRDIRIGLACGPYDCLAIFDQAHALISKHGGVLRLSLDAGGVKNVVIPTETGYAAAITTGYTGKWVRSPAIGGVDRLEANSIADFSHEGTVTGPYQLAPGAHVAEGIGSSLATNGSSILIAAVDTAYEDPRQTPLYLIGAPTRISSVFGQRFSVDVGLIDERQPVIRDPQVIWTGKRYLLVYQRSNESFTHRIEPTSADIHGVWIEPDASGVSGPAFSLTATEEFESLPAIVVNARGLITLAFVRGRGGDNSPNPRLFLRTFADGTGRTRSARRASTLP